MLCAWLEGPECWGPWRCPVAFLLDVLELQTHEGVRGLLAARRRHLKVERRVILSGDPAK